MVKAGHSSEETREALLEAAAEVFAEKGYKGATTRDIAGRAGMNLASIHYHFRDKQGIYLAVINSHIEMLQKAVPLRLDFPKGTPPEARLSQIIDSMLHRILYGGASGEWNIFLREIVDPCGGHDLIVEKIAAPHFKAISSAIAELLGPKATQEQIRYCTLSVVSQLAFQRLARPIIAKVAPEQNYDEESIAALSAHVAKFSLMALKAYRKDIERGK